MKNLNIRIARPDDVAHKKATAKRCRWIAGRANFPTDFWDVYQHLYGNRKNLICFARDEKWELWAYSIFQYIERAEMLYVHGIIIHPDYQSTGLSKKMILTVAEKAHPKYIMARTHNPRIYEMMSKLAEGSIYPNHNTAIPKEIMEIVRSCEGTKDANENMVIKNAYPDEKISQSVKDLSFCGKIFDQIGKNDAVAVLAEFNS